LAAVAGAIDLMQADNITGPYNLVLNPTQYMELATSILGSGAGEREIAMSRRFLRVEILLYVLPACWNGYASC